MPQLWRKLTRRCVPTWRSSCGSPCPGGSRALSDGRTAALMSSLRQIGVGSQGGAEVLAISHQLIFDKWPAGNIAGAVRILRSNRYPSAQQWQDKSTANSLTWNRNKSGRCRGTEFCAKQKRMRTFSLGDRCRRPYSLYWNVEIWRTFVTCMTATSWVTPVTFT